MQITGTGTAPRLRGASDHVRLASSESAGRSLDVAGLIVGSSMRSTYSRPREGRGSDGGAGNREGGGELAHLAGDAL
jgi:hypothetical protein